MTESSDDLKALKKNLKKSNTFKKLGDLISSIVITESRADYIFMKKALPLFKKLLCDMVDNIWNSSKAAIESTLPKPLKHIRHITSVPKLRNHKNRENQLFWSHETINQSPKTKENTNVVSEFSYVKGSVSFAKSKRELNPIRAPSPGPSCYFFDMLKQKVRSPRVVFPKSQGDRASYIPISVSPGPNKYYSSIYPLVKHS